MSNLKLRSPLARPSRANGALVPACCAAVLAGLAGLQLVLTGDVALPAVGWSGGGARVAMPTIAGTAIPGRLLTNPIFSPARTGGGADGAVAEGPLGATSVAGAITIGGRSFAMIARADGAIVRLPVGGRLDDMQLLALSPEGAIFRKDGKRIFVAYGPARTQPAAQDAGYQEEQE